MVASVGGHGGWVLDLQVSSSWTGGCSAPGGRIVAVPFLLTGLQGGPTVAVSPDHPLRLILLDLTDGRSMAVAIFEIGPAQPVAFDEQVSAAMPIVDSFRFH